MHQLLENIIAPYFEAKKRELSLPSSQVSIWKIDCWSVHRSKEFLAWMKKHHDNMTIIFCLTKLSIECSAHRDIVDEAVGQIQAGKAAHEIQLNTKVGVLRDRSVGWVVQAIHDIEDPTTITRAFKMCRVGDFNLSQASLTSAEALAALRHLPTENLTLYAALTQTSADTDSVTPAGDENLFRDVDVYGDCDLPLDVVAQYITSGGSSVPDLFSVGEDGSLARGDDAEKLDPEGETPAVLGRVQRKKIAVKCYQAPIWDDH
ncbi:hypothetical protein K438DRAFT_1997083 [Mycena galopus ATCC 62051]|nr:hypothetical protein K438DRAFT_1997083 [Mycena galopus ATCC 62051]